MSDLIDRQAAIDALEREKTYCTAFRDGYTQINVFEKYNAGLTDGIKALKNLPSAQPDVPDTNVGDLISRKAAIKAIEDLQDCYNGFSDTYDKACIIGVLEELPSAQPDVTEKDVAEYCRKRCLVVITSELFQRMKQAQPERKEGRWVIDRGLYKCSNCNHIWSELWWVECCPIDRMNKIMKFCPNCGARMGGDAK